MKMALDFHENAINNKLRIILNDPEEQAMSWLQSDMRKNISKPHKHIDPFPGACIKTWTEDNNKVFINICHSKQIPPPKDISDDDLLQEMMVENPNFIISMAIGLEKMAKDNVGIERSTFDVLINTNYYEKCMKKPHFWKFTIVVILNSINNKYDKFINTSKYIILKNCKVMGSLNAFDIEDREVRKSITKKPLIEMLGEQQNENIPHKPKITASKSANQQNYIILKSKDRKNVISFFYLPLAHISDITVDIGENRIVVTNQKPIHSFDVFIPHTIDTINSIATYDSKLNVLRLILPLKNEELH